MGYLCLEVFAVLLFCCNISAYERLLKPCKQTDAACLRAGCTELLNRTSKGIGEPYNIAPFEPLELPPMEFPGVGEPATMIHMRHIKVKGLKDILLGDLKLDAEEKKVRFNATTDLVFSAGIKIDFVGKEKSLKGYSETSIKTAVHVEYPFSLDKDENGGLHLVIHPETTTCESLEPAAFIFCPKLTESLANDTDIKEIREKYKNEIAEADRKFVCKISDLAFPAVVEAFRKASKVMTMQDYFLDFKEE